MNLVDLLQIFVGLSGGIAVGSGLVAFITVLDIIPRLAQVTYTQKKINIYQWALITGAVLFTVIDLFHLNLGLPLGKFFIILYGSFAGIFVGLLAAALTEVINVLPILAKRIGMSERLIALLMAMVLGKVLGSLFHWIIFLKP
jgi:stage V sporulation protein AB